MDKKNQKSSTSTLRVFIILIVFSFLGACSSSPGVKVDDRSRAYAYKGKTYRVAAGDTLFSIAWRYGVDLKKLAEFNGIKPPYTIYPSQQIRLDIPRSTIVLTNSSNPKNTAANRVGDKASKSGYRSEKRSSETNLSSNNDNFQGSPKWQWPASGKLIAPFQGDTGLNKGIDLHGKLGEPVLAAASGRVVYAGSGLSGYGKLLIIKHNETFLSAYAHNDEISVKEGDFVKAGQRIADMGSSGTDRVKLHFEIRSEGSPVDPLKYLPKRQ